MGVVPAAGYASRLQPLVGSKETYPIAGRPVMDHLVERMRRAGCVDIRVVTRPEKVDVIAHAERSGLTVITAHPRSVSESLLVGLERTDPDEVVLIGFPDTIWEPLDGFVRLVKRLPGFDVALGLFEGRDLARSDVVQVNEAGLVIAISVKPTLPSSRLIWDVRRRGGRLSTVCPGIGSSGRCSIGSLPKGWSSA